MTPEEKIEIDKTTNKLIAAWKSFLKTPFVLKFAIAIILFGIFLACVVINNYLEWNSKYKIQFGPFARIEEHATFSDLANVLLGTTGLVFTFAGIILFFYTIKQTKDEMMNTQKIFRRQLAESTFFNLMENYRKNIFPELEASFIHQMDQLKTGLKGYNDALKPESREFRSFESTYNSPISLYLYLKTVKQVGDNLSHIANLIHINLKEDSEEGGLSNESFFHKSFFYSLNPEEKFLIGMICANKFDFLSHNYAFDYTSTYREEKTYFNEEESGYFPPVRLGAFKPFTTIVIESFSKISFTEAEEIAKKTSLSLKYPSSVTWKGIGYYRKYQAEPTDPDSVKLERNFSYNPISSEFNLFDMFKEQIFPIFSAKVNVIEIKLGFVFEYKDTPIIVYANMLKIGLDRSKTVTTKKGKTGYELVFDF